MQCCVPAGPPIAPVTATSSSSLSPLRLQHDGGFSRSQSTRPLCYVICSFISGREPRPTRLASLPEPARPVRTAIDLERTFLRCCVSQIQYYNQFIFAYFGLRNFPPLELSWCTYSVSSVVAEVFFFFFALVFFGSRKLVLTVVYQVLTTNTSPAGEQF